MPLQGVRTLLRRCTDLVPTGGFKGTCVHAITAPATCKQLPLRAGGTLALVKAYTCPPGAWAWGLEAGGAGEQGRV